MFPQNTGSKWPEAFTILDFQIHHRLHLRRTRIADNAAATQSTRPKFHSSLVQTHDLSLRKQLRNYVGQLLARMSGVSQVVCAQVILDLLFTVAWSKI